MIPNTTQKTIEKSDIDDAILDSLCDLIIDSFLTKKKQQSSHTIAQEVNTGYCEQ